MFSAISLLQNHTLNPGPCGWNSDALNLMRSTLDPKPSWDLGIPPANPEAASNLLACQYLDPESMKRTAVVTSFTAFQDGLGYDFIYFGAPGSFEVRTCTSFALLHAQRGAYFGFCKNSVDNP